MLIGTYYLTLVEMKKILHFYLTNTCWVSIMETQTTKHAEGCWKLSVEKRLCEESWPHCYFHVNWTGVIAAHSIKFKKVALNPDYKWESLTILSQIWIDSFGDESMHRYVLQAPHALRMVGAEFHAAAEYTVHMEV